MSGVVVIAGPTAGGKSALALELAGRLAADRLGAVLINADSMQVYRELRVLSARPDPAAERKVPHRLYGILPAAEPCSAARWRALALDQIAAARDAGRLQGFLRALQSALPCVFLHIQHISAELAFIRNTIVADKKAL